MQKEETITWRINPNSVFTLSTQWQGEDKLLTSNGDEVLLQPVGEDYSHLWRFLSVGQGYYRLVNIEYGSGRSLDASPDNLAILEMSTGFISQHWKLEARENDYYRFFNKHWGSDFALDIINDGVNNKVALAQQGNFSGQLWRLRESGQFSEVNPFHYYRATNQWQGLDRVLTSTAGQVRMQEPGQEEGQKWRCSPITGERSFFRLSTHQSGFENSLSFGANQQLQLHSTESLAASQQWDFWRNPQGQYKISNKDKGFGFSVDVINDGTNNLLHLTQEGNYSGQFWRFEQLEEIEEPIDPDYYYRLTTLWQGEGKALDIVNDGVNNNRLRLANTENVSGQYWRFTPTQEGFFQLTCQWQGTEKPLTEQLPSPRLQGTEVNQTQNWKVIPTGKGYFRLAPASLGDGYNLDVANQGNKDVIVLAKVGNYSGQLWKLTKERHI